MTFHWLAACEGIGRICTQRMLGKGDIELDSSASLERFLTAAQQEQGGRGSWRGLEICFDSQGGDLQGALQLGGLIRALRIDTCAEPHYAEPPAIGSAAPMPTLQSSTPAMCASACVFALAAGVHRTVTKGARVGMHQFVGDDGDLGQRRTQATIAELAQYLERNGVQPKLLDIGAYISHSMIRFLTAEQISDTNLDNTAQIYEAWNLGAWQDGKVYAHVKQRNPITDSWTQLIMSKQDDRLRLDIIFYPAEDDRNGSKAGDSASPMLGSRDLMHTLSAADIWLRVDDEDFAQVSKAPWSQGRNNAYVRTIEVDIHKAMALRGANLLEAWVMLPQTYARQNPTMSFQLETLQPILAAVLR